MNPTLIAALIGAAGMIIGAITTLFIQSRRLPSDIRLADAQAEKAQHEASSIVIRNLIDEVGRLRLEFKEFREQTAKEKSEFEARLTKSEAKASHSNEFRLAVISLGERLDKERANNRDMIVKLVDVIDHLLNCIEDPGRAKDIDRPAITKLISDILSNYPPEQFVRI